MRCSHLNRALAIPEKLGSVTMQLVFDTREHLNIVWKLAEQISVKRQGHNEFISAMFFVSISHCDAVQTLVEKKNFASAFSLVRPTLENTFRAVWLRKCANKDQANKAIYKDKWNAVGKNIELIEEEYEDSMLFSKLWEMLKPFVHDFTHGGSELTSRHISKGGFITPTIDDQEVSFLLQLTVLVSTYVLAELVELSGEKQFEPYVEKLANQTCTKVFGTDC